MKTSYLIIGGVVLLGAAYLYTHKATKTPAATSPSSTTQQTTAGKWLSAAGGALQSFAGVFTKTSTTARTAPSSVDDAATALANAAHLEIDNSIQL